MWTLLLWQSPTYAHFVRQENLIVLRSLLKEWNHFWKKCLVCNPWLFAGASFPFWYPWHEKANIALRMSLRNKKMINYQLKGLHKTTCYKTKSNFSKFFFFHWLLYECSFLFPYQRISKFWKIDNILSIKMEKIWKYW